MSFPCIAGDPSHCFIIILCRRGRFSLRIRFSARECSLASSLNQNGSRKPSALRPVVDDRGILRQVPCARGKHNELTDDDITRTSKDEHDCLGHIRGAKSFSRRRATLHFTGPNLDRQALFWNGVRHFEARIIICAPASRKRQLLRHEEFEGANRRRFHPGTQADTRRNEV